MYIYKLSLILTNFVKSNKILLLIIFSRYEVPGLLEGGAYLKVTEINTVKGKPLSFFFSFKIKMKQIFTINKPQTCNKKSKY